MSDSVKTSVRALAARLWPFLAVAVLCLGLGYFAGARGRPVHVEEKSHVEEKTHVEKTEEVKAAEKVVEVKRRVRVVKRETYRPDGTVATRTTSTTGDVTKTVGTSNVDTAKSETSDNLRTVTTAKITDYRPNWRVSALVGAELQNPFRPQLRSPFGDIAYGVHTERRIIGPFWGGLWVLGVGPAKAWYGGASLGFEF